MSGEDIFMETEEYMALRPTRKAWKCPYCGVELYTVEVIKAHKERCPKRIVEE